LAGQRLSDHLELRAMPQLLEHREEGGGRLDALLVGDERPARSELRRQIARLELELGELISSAFPRGGIEYSVAPAGGPRMLGIAELEQVRDSLASRIGDVRGILAGHAYVEERNREFLERVIAEPEKYHWVRISNEDIGEPGCRHWHSRPRYGLLGMLLGWWRIKLSSGCPLAEGRRPPEQETETAQAQGHAPSATTAATRRCGARRAATAATEVTPARR
jgi:hypothetical protein